MTDKEYYKNKYYLQLKEMSRFPVWTINQIERFLKISHHTVPKLVNENIIYTFNIDKCKFYTVKNKTYTNNIIIKSIMDIDSAYRVDYSDIANFRYDSSLDEKSLISRNVKKIGTNGKVNYFNIYNVNSSTRFDKIVDLMIDIENLTDKPPIIMIYTYNVDTEELKQYIENNFKIIVYLMSGRLEYIIVDVDYPHFKYLQL